LTGGSRTARALAFLALDALGRNAQHSTHGLRTFSPRGAATRDASLRRDADDAELATRTGQPIRADVQLARKIIAEEGFAGLFRALKRGAALPVLAFAPLVQLLEQAEEVNRGE